MAISKRRRFDVFKRDRFTCQYCGKRPPDVMLEVDHVLAASKGGPDEMINLVTSCFDCNRGKHAQLLTEIPASISDSQARTIEKLEQTAAFNRFILKNRRDVSKCAKILSEYWTDSFGHAFTKQEIASVKRFINRLGLQEVFDSVDTTLGRCKSTQMAQLFRYFCGVCWSKIRDLETRGTDE